MDKLNNSNSSLALQKFYNQQNHDIRLLELQQRLKTEKINCQIEMSKVEEQNQLVKEQNQLVEEKVEEQVEEQIEEKVEEQIGESLGEIYYRSNENFEIDKPVTLERTKSTINNQVKINNLIKLKNGKF